MGYTHIIETTGMVRLVMYEYNQSMNADTAAHKQNIFALLFI